MACLQTLTGIKNSCSANLGGIKRAWFGQFGQFDIAVTESAHTVSTMTAASGATDAKLYEYEFARQTGSLTSTITVDETAGVRYYTNVAALQFSRLEAEKHVEIEALAQGQLVGIFEDMNGNFWLCGQDNYMSLTEQEAGTGTAFTDRNGYTTSLSQMSAHLPYKIEYSTFSGLIDA